MRLFAFILAAVVLEISAVAQRVPDARASENLKAPTLDQVTSYPEMTDCQMRPNVEAAKALLASTSIADASRHAARFKWQSCSLTKRSNSTMSVVPNNPKLDELRWMSADYLLSRNPQLAAGLTAIPKRSAYVLDWFAASSRDDLIDAMGACVADMDPQGIVALSKTQVGSADERATFGRLVPFLSACLRSGVTFNGNKKATRGALIDALYQRARVELPGRPN